jgi:hypothetical protein
LSNDLLHHHRGIFEKPSCRIELVLDHPLNNYDQNFRIKEIWEIFARILNYLLFEILVEVVLKKSKHLVARLCIVIVKLSSEVKSELPCFFISNPICPVVYKFT